MFGLERTMTVEHEILKENHETLMKDYECLQVRIKHAEDTYEVIKSHLQNKAKELEVSNKRLLEECGRERSEKEKVKKTFEEMKKTMESERDAIVDELMTKNQELLLAKRKEEEEWVKVENKYVELAEKFLVVEAECAHLNSLYDAEVVASVTQSAVMSGIGETDNLVGQGENEVNHNANNAGTDVIVSDKSDAEHDNRRSVHRNQEEQCRNRENSSKENQALGETFTPRSINNPPPISPSLSSSSSSSSSSDSYEVVVKLPHNWPEWAIPKGPGSGSNKS